MRIVLDQAFAVHTDGIVGFDCEAATLEQAFAVLFVEFPQLILHLSADKGKEAALTCARLNGRYLEDLSELYQPVDASSVLELTKEVPDGSGKAMSFLPGVLMITVGLLTLPAGGITLVYAGIISIAAAGIGMLLTPTPYLPNVSSADNSPTLYGFDGVRNTTESGTPLPIVYGRRRVGGHILGIHTEAVELAQILFGLLGVCEGRIAEVEYAETQFNTLPVSAYTKWAQVARLGGVAQSTEEGTAPADVFAVGISSWGDLYREAAALGGSTAYVIPGNPHGDSLDYFFEYVLEPVQAPWVGVDYSINDYYIPFHKLTRSEGEGGTLRRIAALMCDVYTIVGGVVTARVAREVLGTHTGQKTHSGTVEWVNTNPSATIRVLFYIGVVGFVSANNVTINAASLPDTPYPYVNLNQKSSYSYLNWEYDVRKNGTATFEGTIAGDSPNQQTRSVTLPQFNKIANTTSFGDNKRITETGAVYITEAAASSVRVVVAAKALYNASSGMNPATVTYNVQWENTTGTVELKSEPGILKAATKSEYFSVTTIPDLDPDLRYKITVTRDEPESTSMSVVDVIYLSEITEEIDSSFIYPHTALLGYGIVATDQLSGSPPTVSTIVRGKLVALPEGYDGINRVWVNPSAVAFTQYGYTDNPAFILYDMLTDTRTGLGEYNNFSSDVLQAMQANFIAAANKCDVRAYSNAPTTPRFSCNIVMNNTASAREWIGAVTQTMRATLYYSSGGLFLDVDDSGKLVTQLFNQSNLKDFTATIGSRKYPNTLEVQFSNEEDDFSNTVIVIEDPSLQVDPSLERRSKTISMAGTTNRNQAISLGQYAMLLGKLCTHSVTFKTGTEGLIASIGDVIGVQHDSTEWGHGGRITSITGSTLTLDAPFTMEAGSYKARISSRTAGTGSEEETIQSFNGAAGTITLSALPSSFVPAVGDLVIFGPAVQSVKPFRILSLKRSDVEEVEITAIEYVESIYAAAEDIDWSDGIAGGSIITVPPPITLRRSVSNVTAEPNYYQDSSGNWKVGIDVWYTKPVLSTWKGAILNWKKAEDTKYMNTPMDTGGHFLIPEVLSAGEYNLVVTSVFTTGMQQSPLEALADVTNHPWVNINITMYLPGTSFLEGVTGLRIEGAATDGTFTGKDCVVVWNKPTIIDQALAGSAGSEQWGAGTTTTSQMLKDYTVVVYNMDGTVRRIMFGINTERFVYTHEMNHEDARVVRQFKISVVATDRLGRSSNPVEVTCFNPAPAKVR